MTKELSERAANNEIIRKNLEQFSLFISNTDKRTNNIFEISNPFETILPQLLDDKLTPTINQIITVQGNTLASAMNVKNQLNSVIFDDSTRKLYKPDFDNLSPDVKNKLKSGIYKLGDSKKVEGNLRAVIVDTQNNNTRVEDLTLKEVDERKDNSSELATQLQLKQMYELLLDIQSTQEFQVIWDRNNSILSPFFESRMKVIEAQSETNNGKKVKLLEKASNLMEKSISHIKSDMISNKNEVLKKINQPHYFYTSFERHANFILEDMQLYTKIVGMQMYIDFTLDKQDLAKERFLAYKSSINELSEYNVPLNRGLMVNLLKHIPKIKDLEYIQKQEFASVLEIIHENYRTSGANTDFWLDIDEEVKKINNEKTLLENSNHTIFVEGENNE
ncbi:TPA: hypothetical protein TZW69_000154 [Streptococcus suis]|uniref:Uncharacterized protein n=1 Tax=Streptococcus suis TaxID=1307 RepID=A0A0Z8IFC5_STRSU|nr:hypothetical protein [Streptococcus suis]MCQ8784916.1 hypothetical protein [Streptococcus suis]MDW8721298.1 hypothetical protein [Streptococcus suis]MDY7596842.1 hypothetical protein [Streptococcus suis]MEE3745583.1 hypothetical protein [Streptococcus suis]NQH42723.1 hypothetical protein [Streptococcus suis]